MRRYVDTHQSVAKAAENSGIRAQISVPVSDDNNAWSQGAQQALDRALAMHDTYARHPRIGIAINLPDLAEIDHATLAKVATYAFGAKSRRAGAAAPEFRSLTCLRWSSAMAAMAFNCWNKWVCSGRTCRPHI